MGKKKRNRTGKCVHCLNWVTDLTDDHVFPKAWYPSSTPENLEKWKIPSCTKCNGDHGRNEADLLVRLGKHFNTDDPEFGDIAQKAMDATDPSKARNSKDAILREKKRKKIVGELQRFDEVAEKHVLPGFGPEWEGENGPYYGIPISENSLKMLSEKIVKGLAYLFDGTLIGNTHRFEFKLLDEPIPEISNMIKQYGGGADRGSGIMSGWAFVKGDPQSRVHYISIWGRWNCYVFVTPKESS